MEENKSRKSEISFGDSLSYTSGISKSSRSESRRARHLAKLKRRNESQPDRRFLFRPRVYESWREGDLDFEAQERERLLKDIAAKEKRLQEKRSKRTQDGPDDDVHTDSSEENQVVKQLDRLKTRKQREEEYRIKLEEDKKRQEEEAQLELEEKLASELQNPSVFGWFYTDGYYDNAPYFGVREDLVPQLAEEQEQWREKWAAKYPETFSAMFKRFFWPPKYFNKLCKTFRTRGSYMDFPEVIADWPKEVEVAFEREPREYISNRHELFGLTEEEKREDEDRLQEALAEQKLENEGEGDDATKAALKTKEFLSTFDFSLDSDKLDSNAWYYDDEEGQFYKKRLGFDIEYYYDGINHCWRHKKKRGKYSSENQQTPYDYYFDDTNAKFLPREYFQGLDELVYDHKTAVYRIHQISKKPTRKNKSGKTIIEFPEFNPDTELQYNEEGETIGVKGDPKTKYRPNSYYFDEEHGKWILRQELPEGVNSSDISWDENGKRYSRKFEGVWRGLTGFSPDDYYWSDRTRKFFPKPSRQADNFRYYSNDGVWRKIDEVSPTSPLHSEDISRIYFDDFEGQFKPKDLSQGGHTRYIQGKYSRIWRSVPKPKSNMYPDEFYWDTYKKRWLPRALRLEMLKNAEVARQRNIMEGQKGAQTVWDIKQNDKDVKQDDFYFDTEEGVFLKKRPRDEYVFDEAEGCFKLSSANKKPKQFRFLHEYYFDGDGNFYLKEPGANYAYDQVYHIWKKVGPPVDLSTVNPPPSDYLFDLNEEIFKKKAGVDTVLYDHNLMWEISPSSDPNFKCPDDYFFHEADGRFYPKDSEVAKAKNYTYDQTLGAWTLKGVKGPSPTGLSSRNFYWDDTTRSFKLKVASREKADYFWDANNKIFRHILSSGSTKSGLRPSDFTWNHEFRAYIPMSFLRKPRTNITDDLPKWDPLRLYDKPWISDTSTTTLDVDESKSVKSGKLPRRNNKVAPSPSESTSTVYEEEPKSKSKKKKKWQK